MQRIRELLQQLTLHFQVEIAIADQLEALEGRIKALEDENVKTRAKLQSLEKRYGDLLMALNSINKKIPNPLK